jgi:hypothetical protein
MLLVVFLHRELLGIFYFFLLNFMYFRELKVCMSFFPKHYVDYRNIAFPYFLVNQDCYVISQTKEFHLFCLNMSRITNVQNHTEETKLQSFKQKREQKNNK